MSVIAVKFGTAWSTCVIFRSSESRFNTRIIDFHHHFCFPTDGHTNQLLGQQIYVFGISKSEEVMVWTLWRYMALIFTSALN
jgi:hypothetical protein